MHHVPVCGSSTGPAQGWKGQVLHKEDKAPTFFIFFFFFLSGKLTIFTETNIRGKNILVRKQKLLL